jgi:DNA modification methylase
MDEKPDCLQDLEKVRHIEGFPLGTDEDICALSDPPYYTAYPNPHLADFIAQHGTPYDEVTDNYHREPFIGDVSEGKSDRIYRVHSYHTKVPHQAIQEFIEHYTDEGAIVLDCFAGTGMAGVAAQFSKRNCILVELSPFASSIAFSLNTNKGLVSLLTDAKAIVSNVERSLGHIVKADVNGIDRSLAYCVWSAFVACPYCESEFSIWDVTVDEGNWTEVDNFACPSCEAALTYPSCKKIIGEGDFTRFVPVRLSISLPKRKRLERRPTDDDLNRIRTSEQLSIAHWFPQTPVLDGEKLSEPKNAHGLRDVSQFYTKRNLHILAHLWHEIGLVNNPKLKAVYTATLRRMTKMNRYMAKHKLNRSRELVGPLDKTVHIPSIYFEANPLQYFLQKAEEYARLKLPTGHGVHISTQSATDLSNIPANSVDYVFTDPPFGHNIQYSELNSVFEAWGQVFTNDKTEAVVNPSRNKAENDYRGMMGKAFAELYRVLKPNRWITVEFHNTKASIWNIIQDSLARAGFVVAQVAVLDKQKGTINQLTLASSVNSDLVINAYKPRQSFVDQFLQKAGAGMERAFIKQHLGYLPIAANVERTREMLYSKMLAYYIQRGYEISLNSPQFYRLLAAEFIERDGYWFRDEAQAQEYEQRKLDPARKRASGQGQGVLFVSDERSAIAWLHHFLAAGPQTYSDIYTAYAKALQTSDDQIPELKQLLEETCVQVNGHWKRPDALTAEELETRRRDRLLRQFNDYLREAAAGQKLTDVRKEAILTGFEEAYRAKRYEDITAVGAKLNRSLVDSSTEIFDFIDIAGAKVS